MPSMVRIRFCGGCNPEIDRRALVERLKRQPISQTTGLCFTAEGTPADILLRINGCAHACLDDAASGETEAATILSVQGCGLDNRAFPEGELPIRVAERLRELVKFRIRSAGDTE